MKKSAIHKNLFTLTFSLFIALHLSLIGTLRIYPFFDLPNHLALATIYRFYGETTNQFAQYFSLDLFPKPNVFHLLFCGSRIFPTVEFGNKLFYLLYVFLFPLSTFLIIKKLRGNPWFSLLSFLLLYNINVCHGFAGFTIAIPFVLLIFCFLIDDLRNDDTRTKFALMVLFVLVFFMHALAALFSLLVFFTHHLYQNRTSLTKTLKGVSLTIPVSILIITWSRYDSLEFRGPSLISYLPKYYRYMYLEDFVERGGFFIHDNYKLYGDLLGYCVALFFSMFIIGLLIYSTILNRIALKDKIRKDTFKPICLFALCSSCCTLFIPSALPGYCFLFQRFSVFLLLSIIICGSILCSEKLHRIAIFSICLVCLVHFVLWAHYFSHFQKENRLFTKDFFPSSLEGKKMAALIYDYRFRGRSVYNNFVDYYIVWKQGIATTRFVDARSFPVRRKVSKDVLPPYIEWVGKYSDYDGRYEHMDHILVRGQVPKEAKAYMVNFKMMKKEGKWTLYKKI